jgi:putative endonuclease
VTDARQRLGEIGEQMAADTLLEQGYSLLTRRFRSRFGEIDIVAKDEDTLVFVEVKARTDREFGDPADAVTVQKQRRIVRMAEEYLMLAGGPEMACRFDVVTIDLTLDPPTISLYKDAFRPGW